jgi:hypothetical protein
VFGGNGDGVYGGNEDGVYGGNEDGVYGGNGITQSNGENGDGTENGFLK